MKKPDKKFVVQVYIFSKWVTISPELSRNEAEKSFETSSSNRPHNEFKISEIE